MKLHHIRVGEFVNLLEHAHGNIYLKTEEGVSFNLSSKLAQLYCIKYLMQQSHSTHISPELEFDCLEDREMFAQSLTYRNPGLNGCAATQAGNQLNPKNV